MKQNVRLVLIWVCMLILAAFAAACSSASTPTTPSATLASAPNVVAASAEELFADNCAKCHGLSGLGDGPSVGSLRTQAGLNLAILKDKTDDELYETISVGKGSDMPPWELVLTKEQRQALVQYVRTLQK